jgi:hypothetical protein
MISLFTASLRNRIPTINQETGTIKITFVNGDNDTYTAHIVLSNFTGKLSCIIREVIKENKWLFES